MEGPIRFQILLIEEKSFELLDVNPVPELLIDFSVEDCTFRSDAQGRLACQIRLTCTQNEKTLFAISLEMIFGIASESWANFESVHGRITIPKNFAIHLITLAIGTIRGVVLARTAFTPLKNIPVALINAQEMIQEDVILSPHVVS